MATPEGRLNYPHLVEPQAFKNNAPKYSVEILFDEGTNLEPLKEAARTAMKESWPKVTAKQMEKAINERFMDGDERDSEVYHGTTFLRPKSSEKWQPDCFEVNENGKAVSVQPEAIYSGCYGRLSLRAFAYDDDGVKGVTFLLNVVVKTRDGERLGSTVNTDEALADMGLDAESFGMDDEEPNF